MSYSPAAFRDGVFSQAWPLVRYQGSVNSIADGSLGNARRGVGLTPAAQWGLAALVVAAVAARIYYSMVHEP